MRRIITTWTDSPAAWKRNQAYRKERERIEREAKEERERGQRLMERHNIKSIRFDQ